MNPTEKIISTADALVAASKQSQFYGVYRGTIDLVPVLGRDAGEGPES